MLGATIALPGDDRGQQVHDVDEAAPRPRSAGLGLPEARRARRSATSTIEVWPDWVTKIPTRDDRITFTLAEPGPEPSPTP